MKIAIITGATSGLGSEYLKNIYKMHPELDNIWIVARRKDRLDKLCEQYPKAIPIVLDLCKEESMSDFSLMLEKQNPEIRVLVNNAGFGELGNFYENDYKNQMSMIDLNNRALTALCTICVKYMTAGAYIINIASIASFAPTPRMAVYCSTKAYVKSFTRCIRFELKKKKINAIAVCPGPMATEFLDVAGISGGKSKTFETLPYCNASVVAKKSIVLAKRGRGVYTPKVFYKFYRFMAKVLPHGFVMFLSKT